MFLRFSDHWSQVIVRKEKGAGGGAEIGTCMCKNHNMVSLVTIVLQDVQQRKDMSMEGVPQRRSSELQGGGDRVA